LAEKDLAVIEKLIQKLQPVKILIIGDLFHSKHNREFELFAEWREKHADIEVILVRGNHDIIPAVYYKQANVKVHLTKLDMGPFLFVHEPLEDYPGPLYLISGHLHPAIRLSGKGRQSLVLPCFYFGDKQSYLPAFGHFTGSSVIRAYKNDSIFAIVGNEIRKLGE
jgi:DNA ligase-associated metallophosphoesterase